MRDHTKLRAFEQTDVRRLSSGVRPPRGFTLAEVMVAVTITVLVITGALSTFIYGLRSWQAEAVKNEINIDLEGAMERIRQDLRLSSVGIGLMAFYPAKASEYTAISFPISTVDADGLLVRDESTGKIKWTQTIIYHVLPGDPDQLRRAVFSPRYTNVTPSDLYAQLQSVVQGNTTSACLAGESVSEQVVFQNLVNLKIRPPGIMFDGYAPSYCKAQTFNWGSAVLSNGNHSLKFTIEGRNPSNTTGYKVGLDKFSLSPSASPREGEIYLPANGHPASPYYTYALSGGSLAAEDMSSNGASWSGNCQLIYAGAALSNSITLVAQNDLWCDANFDAPPGIIASNVTRKTDISFISSDPFIPDIVIAMKKGTTWTAAGCTDGTIGSVDVSNTTPAVVNIIYGGTNSNATISMNGVGVRVLFEAGTNGSLYIGNAKISRQLSGTTPVPGTTADLYFSGIPSKKIMPGAPANSDWVANYVIDRANNYLVQFDLYTGSEIFNKAQGWTNSSINLSALGGVMTKMIVGVSALEVRYPSNGMYCSGIFDTQLAAPDYRSIHWTEGPTHTDADLDVLVRSGDNSNLSDASAWMADAASLPPGRYFQYQALFSASGSHTNTAVLRDVTIDWDAPTGLVDLQVDFAKGPDYGIVSATVDGQSFVKGLEIEMEIFKRGPYGTNTATGTMEVRPLNTNK
ncbi:MAG: prepilin-type N-terminal cleavage/methylation domain-containing protein [Kiritimatiellae bacterium]|nr:prepilin-type N-terminal cleavage/methylation domain-containing protein [Kiritimatiellia bacterium]